MSIQLIDNDGSCRLVFEGRLTYQFAQELENQIIDALRRYTHFELDLAGIREIDLHGLHLLRLLITVGGEHVQTVSESAVVDLAQRRLLSSVRSVWLRGSRAEHAALA